MWAAGPDVGFGHLPLEGLVGVQLQPVHHVLGDAAAVVVGW